MLQNEKKLHLLNSSGDKIKTLKDKGLTQVVIVEIDTYISPNTKWSLNQFSYSPKFLQPLFSANKALFNL